MACLLLILLTGCGQGDNRQAVHGTVTLDGKPLPEGVIRFQPAPGVDGNTSGGPILNGRFDIPAAKGLQPGSYLVQIQSFEETGRMVTDPMSGASTPDRAPILFRETSLKATITAGAETAHDFALTRQRAAAR
jgi:hypothetical protein